MILISKIYHYLITEGDTVDTSASVEVELGTVEVGLKVVISDDGGATVVVVTGTDDVVDSELVTTICVSIHTSFSLDI